MPNLAAPRTLEVPYPEAAPLFGECPAKLIWPDKSSAGVLAFGLDVTDWATTLDGVPYAITSLVVSPTGQTFDLAVSAGVLFGNVLAFTAASGIPGTLYKVGIGVQTNDGSSEVFEAFLPINFDSVSTLPPIGLLPPGAPPMVVSLNQTAGASSVPFPIVAQVTGFSTVVSPNNYCQLPVNPGVPIIIINQDVGGSPLIVVPPTGVSINGLTAGTSVEIPAPTVVGAVQQSTFIYGTIAPNPTQIEAY